MDNILIVEDDFEIAYLLKNFFVKNGLKASFTHCVSDAYEMIRNGTFTTVILDIMLPNAHGFSVCREIRKFSDIPIIFVTALTEVTDRIVGLELGADDYVTKPFEPRELLARIGSIRRRVNMSLNLQTVNKTEKDFLEFGTLKIHKLSRLVTLEGREVNLSTKEFDILVYLASRPLEVVSRESLITAIHGSEASVFDRAIDTAVSRVRTKIGDDAKNSNFIKTIRGAGYIFVASKPGGSEKRVPTNS